MKPTELTNLCDDLSALVLRTLATLHPDRLRYFNFALVLVDREPHALTASAATRFSYQTVPKEDFARVVVQALETCASIGFEDQFPERPN
jgi:hypothetical protein